MKPLVRLASLLLFTSSLLTAQVAVTTYHNDNSRSGANSHETILTPANVDVNTFAAKPIFAVQGCLCAAALFAEPLHQRYFA